MSSTNKTTHYELSQFLGTDKPAWLNDYNSDMNKIDTGINTAQGTASSADSKATTNASAIGTLANLTTTDKTNLVSAINEVDTEATAAGNTASAAATTANAAQASANAAIAGLQRFNLTNKSTLSPTSDRGTINTTVSNVQFACDSTSSVFKIYGRVYIGALAGISGTINIKIGDTSLRPESAYTINTAAIVSRLFTNNSSDVLPRNITVNVDGSITLTDTLSGSVADYSIMLPPCLYFNSDFGDE